MSVTLMDSLNRIQVREALGNVRGVTLPDSLNTIQVRERWDKLTWVEACFLLF